LQENASKRKEKIERKGRVAGKIHPRERPADAESARNILFLRLTWGEGGGGLGALKRRRDKPDAKIYRKGGGEERRGFR